MTEEKRSGRGLPRRQEKQRKMANSERPEIIDESGDKYKYGFVTDIEAETARKGLMPTLSA